LAKSLVQRVGEESWQRAGRSVGKAEIDADMVEEKLDEEEVKDTEEK
jgi:hypothetical protein